MKRFMAATATILFVATTYAAAALAQNGPPPANPNARNPAIASPSTNADAPAAGANSFTEGQAKSRIEAAGFSNVSGLMKDKDGIWRGTASKGGTTASVALDFQGNVVTK